MQQHCQIQYKYPAMVGTPFTGWYPASQLRGREVFCLRQHMQWYAGVYRCGGMTAAQPIATDCISVQWTHLNQDWVSTIGVQDNPDFALRQAIILVHGEGVSFIALRCGTSLTAPVKLTSTETCTYMLTAGAASRQAKVGGYACSFITYTGLLLCQAYCVKPSKVSEQLIAGLSHKQNSS